MQRRAEGTHDEAYRFRFRVIPRYVKIVPQRLCDSTLFGDA
ncbi:MAG: hypothetical protein PHE53_11455 [Thermoguttaceae bacterium]|nr:hypothetical protein [Thermoguttaceae bacterium]